ncbi:MAG: ATP-binding protein [Verrucomicrobiota bacterium]|jgi:PAS domain S-box-containing protein
MKKNQDQPTDAAALRRRAEERLSEQRKSQSSEAGDQRTAEDTARLVHELQVHQIELEMQNEELRQARAQVEALLAGQLQQARAQADALLAQYTDLYDFAPTAYLTLDREGAIRQLNLTGARLLGLERARLLKRRFGLFVAEGDRRAFSDFLQKVFASEAKEGCEVTLPQAGPQPLLVRIEGTRFQDRQECRAVVLDITERKRAEKSVRMFSQEIIAAREEEKKKVASVLHHDVGSLAVGISAHLDLTEEHIRSGKPGEALELIRRTRKLFDESVARLKGVAVQLRPPELDAIGLCGALRQYFSAAPKHGGTRIHFKETLGRRRVPEGPATILFRAAQEALTNAITHGRAQQVDVDLRASKAAVTLTIHDNGKEFDPSEQMARITSQMGLRVMREMALSAGGAFTVDSGRGKGTTVRVRLPLK